MRLRVNDGDNTTWRDVEVTVTKQGNGPKTIDLSATEILDKIKQWDCNLVEVTGGEPLFQDECSDLLKELIQYGSGSYRPLNTTSFAKKVRNAHLRANMMAILQMGCITVTDVVINYSIPAQNIERVVDGPLFMMHFRDRCKKSQITAKV